MQFKQQSRFHVGVLFSMMVASLFLVRCDSSTTQKQGRADSPNKASVDTGITKSAATYTAPPPIDTCEHGVSTNEARDGYAEYRLDFSTLRRRIEGPDSKEVKTIIFIPYQRPKDQSVRLLAVPLRKDSSEVPDDEVEWPLYFHLPDDEGGDDARPDDYKYRKHLLIVTKKCLIDFFAKRKPRKVLFQPISTYANDVRAIIGNYKISGDDDPTKTFELNPAPPGHAKFNLSKISDPTKKNQ